MSYRSVIFTLFIAGCSNQLDVKTIGESRAGAGDQCQTPSNAGNAECASFSIAQVPQIVVTPGKPVRLSGSNFRSSLKATAFALGLTQGAPAEVKVLDANTIEITLQPGTEFGPVALSLDQDGRVQKLMLFSNALRLDHPVITAPVSLVCKPLQFYDANGELQTGTRDCEKSVPDCQADGATDCVSNAIYPAIDKRLISANKILVGTSIAGVSGSAIPAPPLCTADGQKDCVANTDYVAARVTGLAGRVLSGETVAGVAGTITLPSPSRVLSGESYGIGGNAATGSLTLPPANLVRVGAGAYGVGGTSLIPTLADCVANGASGCVTTSTYRSADLSNLAPGNIRNGIAVAGVSGSYPSLTSPLAQATATTDLTSFGASSPVGSFEFFDSAGNRYTATIADAGTITPTAELQLFGTVGTLYRAFAVAGDVALAPENIRDGISLFGVSGTVTAAAAPCASDGATGCIATNRYRAADTLAFSASDIRTGRTIASVLGGLATCSIDGATGCITDAAFRSADMSLAVAANIRSGTKIAGILGSLSPAPLNCAADGAINCVAVNAFKAADMSQVSAGNIRSGVTIAGVTGEYPSVAYKLPGANQTADLVSLAASTAAGSYEWWGPDGSRYIGSISDPGLITASTSNQLFNDSVYRQFTVVGDSDLVPANIKNATNIFGVTGIFSSSINDCTSDGQTACVTTNRFKAMDTDALQISSWDIRAGKTAGGIAGSLNFFKNMANTGLFDRDSGTAGDVGLDVYDTLDDYNNNDGNLPGENNTGWVLLTTVHWRRDSASDTGAGGGIALNSECDGTEHCVYIDSYTGVMWAQADASIHTWESAISSCDGLNTSEFGGYDSGWRLATQKELMQAYINGLWSLRSATKLNLSSQDYWSATSASAELAKAFSFRPDTGALATIDKTTQMRRICVR